MDGERRLKLTAAATALSALVFSSLYFVVRQRVKDGAWRFDALIVNKALGVSALFLIVLSLLLTGAVYFGQLSKRPLAQRKYHGLAGFWLGLAHSAMTHFGLGPLGLHPERRGSVFWTDALGLGALVLLAAMAALSNPGAKGLVGGDRWRRALRFGGYAAIGLAVLHTALLKGHSWVNFFRTFDPVLPSLSLPVAAAGVAAILLRAGIWIAERRRR